MGEFWIGLFVGFAFAGWVRVCFAQKFTIYDSRRGWVLRWEGVDDDYDRGLRDARAQAGNAPSTET